MFALAELSYQQHFYVFLFSLPTAASCPAVPGLLVVSGVPLEVSPPDPPYVRLLRHARLVRSGPRGGPHLLLQCRRGRHLSGVLRHPSPRESVLQRLCLHPPGLLGDAVCGLLGGVLALLLQDSRVG